MDRAVLVDVDERACLIEPGRGKRDAEFHRGERKAPLDDRTLGIRLADRQAPFAVIRACLELVDDFADNIVLDTLMIGRQIALADTVEIALSHIERVEAGGEGDLLDQALGAEHSLRAAEAAEGRVRASIRLEGLGYRAHSWVEIAIIGVKERAIGHRAGEIGREAATRRIDEVGGLDDALIIEAHLVIDEEIMPLAGDRHVVIAIGTAFHGAAELLGRERGEAGEEVALRLLAAEGASHAAHLDGHGVGRNAKHMRNHVLHLARMLGRGMNGDVIVFARNGESDLALEIEMLLTADMHRALEAPRRGAHGGNDVAALELQRLGDEGRLGTPRLLDGHDGGEVFVGNLREEAGASRRVAAFADDREDRLAVIGDEPAGKERLVMPSSRAHVVYAWNIGRGEHGEHPWRGADRIEVERDDLRVGALGKAEIDMRQPIGLWQVVDIERLARHMLMRRIMRQRLMHAASRRASADSRGGRLRRQGMIGSLDLPALIGSIGATRVVGEGGAIDHRAWPSRARPPASLSRWAREPAGRQFASAIFGSPRSMAKRRRRFCAQSMR